jgi:hypothetical protein
MEAVPKSHNWVKARSECSIEHLFMLLAEVVDTDVKTINERDMRSVRFEFKRLNESKFLVVKSMDYGTGMRGVDSVVFERTRAEIAVYTASYDGPKAFFTAKPSFDGAGSCRLEVSDQPLELWQVSRKALEDLFFGEPEKTVV